MDGGNNNVSLCIIALYIASTQLSPLDYWEVKTHLLRQRTRNMQHSLDIFQHLVKGAFNRNVRHNDELNGVLEDIRCDFGVRRQLLDGRVPTDGDAKAEACFECINEDGETEETCCSCDLGWFYKYVCLARGGEQQVQR